MMMND